jgi:hypothetical protein
MTDLERLDDQIRKSFEGDAWHGPSVLEALDGVAYADAAQHPIAGAHSISEVVRHLAATYRLVLRRIGGDATPLTSDEDWPRAAGSEQEWGEDLVALRALNHELRRTVGGFPPDRLDEPLVAEPTYTAFTQFIGITQHDLYHAGQIALLKRALAARESESAPPSHTPTRGLYGWITHTELVSTDPDATKTWCQSVFGWSFKPPFPAPGGGMYHLFAFSEKGGGGIRKAQPSEEPGSSFSVHVEDARASFDRAVADGAAAIVPPTRVMDGVTIAIVRAPGGVPVGISGP